MKKSLLLVLFATACAGAPSSKVAYNSSPSGGGYYAPTQTAAAEPSHGNVTPYNEPAPTERPGLGTTWGEHVEAPISFSPFVRASGSPWAQVALHYNDYDGVMAHAEYVGARPSPLEVAAGDGSLSVSLVDDYGRLLPGFYAAGRALIVGEDNARYRIIVRNATTARFEIVTSVDGLDVIDGKPAARELLAAEPRHDVLVAQHHQLASILAGHGDVGRAPREPALAIGSLLEEPRVREQAVIRRGRARVLGVAHDPLVGLLGGPAQWLVAFDRGPRIRRLRQIRR